MIIGVMQAALVPRCCVRRTAADATRAHTVTWNPASSPPMTWSMMPYRLASSGDMYRSRSVSSSICARVHARRQRAASFEVDIMAEPNVPMRLDIDADYIGS